MPRVTTDRRSREIDPNPQAVRLAAESAERLLSEMRVLAGRLDVVSRGGSHLALGFSSVRDFARQQLRVPGAVVGLLLDLSRSLEVGASHVTAAEAEGDRAGEAGAEIDEAAGKATSEAGSGGDDGVAVQLETTGSSRAPSVGDRVAGNAMSTENAAALGRLFRQVGRISADERAKWTQLAEDEPPWKFRQLVLKRIEEAAQRVSTVPMAFAVTESARDAFRRARDLASRRAGRRLTEGQTFALVVRRFVRDEDERMVGEKKRRVPDTRQRPGSRYIAARVRRAVKRRARDRCEVPGCSNGAFLQFMHVVEPHREGGSQEIDNLAYGCTAHHYLLDAGVIRFGGWRDGRPVFRDAWGREIREVPEQRESHVRGGDSRGADSSAGGDGEAEGSLFARQAESERASASEPAPEVAALPGVSARRRPEPRDAPSTDSRPAPRRPIGAESNAGAEPIERRTSQTDAWPRDSEPGTGQVAERPPPWGPPEERHVVGCGTIAPRSPFGRAAAGAASRDPNIARVSRGCSVPRVGPTPGVDCASRAEEDARAPSFAHVCPQCPGRDPRHAGCPAVGRSGCCFRKVPAGQLVVALAVHV